MDCTGGNSRRGLWLSESVFFLAFYSVVTWKFSGQKLCYLAAQEFNLLLIGVGNEPELLAMNSFPQKVL